MNESEISGERRGKKRKKQPNEVENGKVFGHGGIDEIVVCINIIKNEKQNSPSSFY